MLKIGKVLALIITSIFLFSTVDFQPSPVLAQPSTITVPDDYQTIYEAIENSDAGDTVFVKNGVYNLTGHGPLIVDKSISIIGANVLDTMIIVDDDWLYNVPLILVNADDVTISGLTIFNGRRSVGIDIEGSRCRVSENQLNCAIFVSGKNNLLYENTISNVSFFAGIMCEHADSTVIMNNTIMHCSDSAGIWIDDSNNTTVKQNNLMNNSDGIAIGFYLNQICNTTIVEENNIEGNGDGVVLGPSYSSYIYGNTIADNFGAGVEFNQNCNNSLIYNNLISQNDVGFRLTNQNQTQKAFKNTVYSNNIIDNKKDVLYDQFGNSTLVSWDNYNRGNYWSNFNGNGVYVIDEDNIDHYPLMHPVDIKTFNEKTNQLTLNVTITIVIIILLVLIVIFLFLYRMRRKKS